MYVQSVRVLSDVVHIKSWRQTLYYLIGLFPVLPQCIIHCSPFLPTGLKVLLD